MEGIDSVIGRVLAELLRLAALRDRTAFDRATLASGSIENGSEKEAATPKGSDQFTREETCILTDFTARGMPARRDRQDDGRLEHRSARPDAHWRGRMPKPALSMGDELRTEGIALPILAMDRVPQQTSVGQASAQLVDDDAAMDNV